MILYNGYFIQCSFSAAENCFYASVLTKATPRRLVFFSRAQVTEKRALAACNNFIDGGAHALKEASSEPLKSQ